MTEFTDALDYSATEPNRIVKMDLNCSHKWKCWANCRNWERRRRHQRRRRRQRHRRRSGAGSRHQRDGSEDRGQVRQREGGAEQDGRLGAVHEDQAGTAGEILDLWPWLLNTKAQAWNEATGSHAAAGLVFNCGNTLELVSKSYNTNNQIVVKLLTFCLNWQTYQIRRQFCQT